MIKSELIASIASTMTDLPEKRVAQSVDHLIDLISDALTQGKRVEIRGFGSFSVRHHSPRHAHNPKTGEKVITHAKCSPYFRPGKELRHRVNASSKKKAIQSK